jgi:ATP-binding cassette, subfamily B, bacterial
MIWRSAPGWTSLSAVVIAIQSAVTLASLYLLKLIVDAVAAGIAPETADDAGFNRAMLLIGLAAGVTIIGVVSRSLAGLAAEAKAQLVTDHMLERLHEKSLAVRTLATITRCTGPSWKLPSVRRGSWPISPR